MSTMQLKTTVKRPGSQADQDKITVLSDAQKGQVTLGLVLQGETRILGAQMKIIKENGILRAGFSNAFVKR